MTSLQGLSISAVFTAILWIPYVLERFSALGIWASINNPSEPDLER